VLAPSAVTALQYRQLAASAAGTASRLLRYMERKPAQSGVAKFAAMFVAVYGVKGSTVRGSTAMSHGTQVVLTRTRKPSTPEVPHLAV
jgi:hypothetical protein